MTNRTSAQRRLLDGLGTEFALAFGGGVRLGGQQLRVKVGGFPAVVRAPTELGTVECLALAEQQVIRFALDPIDRHRQRVA